MVGCKVKNPGIQCDGKGNSWVLAKFNKAKSSTFAVKVFCLTGKKLDSKLIEDAAAESTRNVDVIEDINGSSEYRAHLTRVYVARAIQTAMHS